MSLLCRELVDLLKMAPQSRIPFSKFIPAYHHHFGRQCRVADYGYTRLIDLLESLSHVVQVSLTSIFVWALFNNSLLISLADFRRRYKTTCHS